MGRYVVTPLRQRPSLHPHEAILFRRIDVGLTPNQSQAEQPRQR